MSSVTLTPPRKLPPGPESRWAMVAQTKSRLQHLAFLALNQAGLSNDMVLIVCVDVDSCWRHFANSITAASEHKQQPQRDAGMRPTAVAAVAWRFAELLVGEFPLLRDVILKVPPPTKLKGAILDEEGCTIIEIEPRLDDRRSAL